MTNNKCPRREELGDSSVFNLPEQDEWRGDKTCSYCGSLDPDEALRLVEAGEQVDPTDKNYKMYVNGSSSPSGKVYFQHFSREQCERLIGLLNAKKVSFSHPGHFYVRPFFIAKAESR
jgi:hypothetical protein